MKTALITGAASGIGYELACLLAKDNYALILVDIDEEKLKNAEQNLHKINNSTITLLTKDLSQINSAKEIMASINNRAVDILVNNAGFGLFGAFSKTNWERESEMIHLHTYTTTHLTKLILKNMLKRNSGKILNVASLAAFQPGPLMSIYYATKSYLLSFSEALANELKGTGVSLTVLCPGQTRTAFQRVVSSSSSENKLDFNIACPKYVANYGYKALLKGKTVAIPGRFNKFLSVLPRIIPRGTATYIVRRLQEKNRKKQNALQSLKPVGNTKA